MSRTLRGAWSRRHTLVPLLLTTVVLVAGVVAVVGFAEASEASAALAVPLVLLGLVAVPASGRELARVRREEIALARLRGLEGGELLGFLALEPLLVLGVGGLLGVGLGTAGAHLAAATWVDAETGGLSLLAVAAGLAVVAAGLAALVVGTWSALQEPLAAQVRSTVRPGAAGLAAVFVDVLVLTGALVALYRSREPTGGEVDLVVLAGPALVGLAVGQVAVWLVALAAGPVVRMTTESELPGFLAARRLGRVADTVQPLRLLVAAGVVGVLAWTAAAQVGDWTEGSARLRAGAPLQVVVDGTSSDALRMTRELDPDGAYLLAAVMVDDPGRASARRAFLDLSRYAAVLGDFYAATPAAPVVARLGMLQGRAEGLPVLVTDTVAWPDGPPQVDSPGARSFPATVVERVAALPLVERDGQLGDLQRSIAFDTSTIPAATVLVLARADTPSALLEEVVARAGHPVTTLEDVRRDFAADGRAAQAQIYALMAGCSLLVALLALAGATARRRSGRLRELAALRLVGVPRSDLVRAGRLEDAWVALGALLATTAGALVAIRLLLAHLDLVREPAHAVALLSVVDPVPLAAVGVAAAVAVLVAGHRSRAGWADLSRPAVLREEQR